MRVSYKDLISDRSLAAELKEAFGSGETLGAIAISDVPNFGEARSRLLDLSYALAHQDESVLKALEDEESMFNSGWSCGKEKIGDVPDTFKGSFYANPLHDSAGSEEMRRKYPFFFPKNRWPSEALPELEPTFKKLGGIMFETVLQLAKQIDALCESEIPNYEPNRLFEALSTSKKIKGRLLYYYPPPKDTTQADSWIGKFFAFFIFVII